MAQTIDFDRWIMYGSGWEVSFVAEAENITVSRSYGSDYATVTCKAWIKSVGGSTNTKATFWIKIAGTWYSIVIPGSNGSDGWYTYWAGDWYSADFSQTVQVGATSGTLSGQVCFSVKDINGPYAESAYKDWSGSYGSKGASSISSATNVTLNTQGTAESVQPKSAVSWTAYSTSFTYQLTASCNGKTFTRSYYNLNGSTTQYFGFGSDWIDVITTSKTATCTFTLTTKSGSTTIGTSTYNITLTVPSGINPTVDIISVTKSAITTNPFTKICTALDAVLVTWNFTQSYSSALNSGNVTVDGNIGSNTNGYYTSAAISNYGQRNASVTATDKRGNSNSDSITFEAYEYYSPSISVKYNKSGGNYYLNLSGKYASVNGENNTRILKLDVYKSGVKVNQADIDLTEFITAKTGSATPYNDYYEISGAYRIPITDIDGQGTDISDIATETYEFRITAQDRVASNIATVTSGIPVMTLEAGGTAITIHKPVTFEREVNFVYEEHIFKGAISAGTIGTRGLQIGYSINYEPTNIQIIHIQSSDKYMPISFYANGYVYMNWYRATTSSVSESDSRVTVRIFK